MGKLSFNSSHLKKSEKNRSIERNASYCECGGGDAEIDGEPVATTATDDEEEEEDEESMLSRGKHLRQQSLQPQQHGQEASKKTFLLCFIVTTIIVCFCFFVFVPQIIEFFSDSNVIELENTGYSSQQSVIELPDAERSLRNQERLDIMRRFDALQQKYKELQIEYKKAETAYLKKLHSAIQEENLETSDQEVKTVNMFAEPNELEIYKLEDVEKMNKNKSEKLFLKNDKLVKS